MALLAELSIGAKGRVANVLGTDEITIRLMEMGVTPGTELTLVGSAPFGDPLELEVRGYRLSIRRSEAARVEIESI